MESSNATRTTLSGGLHQIRVGPKIGTLIIAVGGVGTTPPEHWTNAKGQLWLDTLDPSTVPDIGILSFPNRLAPEGILSAKEIEKEGLTLLEELKQLANDATLSKCPIILVAHSLGGFIIKRAICEAARREQTVRRIMSKVSAFVLIGCPHSPLQMEENWLSIDMILQKYTKAKRSLPDEQCIKILAEDCARFKRIVDASAAHVLTICETKGTNRQVMGKKVLFVDRNLATIGSAREIVVEENANHRDLCMMSGSTATLELVLSSLHDALETTRSSMAKESPPLEESYFIDSTIRDSSDEESPGFLIVDRDSIPKIYEEPIKTSPELASSTANEEWTKQATTASEKINPDFIAALKDFAIEQRDPTLPCKHILFPRDPVFSGREETLANIRQALIPAPEVISDSESSVEGLAPALNVFSLCGPAGMGKTSIANEFIHKYEKEFDAVFWVTADQESKLYGGFRDISLKLGIVAETDGKDVTAIRETFLAWLANPLKSYQHMDHAKPERASWLLVFDNVDSASTLEDFWPRDAAGSVLVTCRDPLVKSSIHLRNSGTIVPELSEEEGIALLLRLTGREVDSADLEQAPKIVQALGRYPLAIAQMSGVILARDLSFIEFLGLYSEETERREIIDTSEGQSASLRRYNQTLGTVWALDDLKEGRALLEVISFLDPDSIPESLLEKNPACADWDRYPKTSWEYATARKELTSRSLIYRNRDKKTLRVHRLIQDTMRTQMSEETFNEVYARVINMLHARWPRVLYGFGNVSTHWDENGELWAHCLSLFKYRERFDPTLSSVDVRVKWMDFNLDIVWFCVVDSRFSASPELLSFFAFLRNTINEEKPSVALQLVDAYFHSHRGEVAMHTNDRTHPFNDLRTCVGQLERLLDDEAKNTDPHFGVMLNEFGCACMMVWKSEQALEQFERSYHVLDSLKQPSQQNTTMAQINKAFVYGDLGQYETASRLFEHALAARNEELGTHDYTSFVNGKLYMGWGNVLAAQGKLNESFKLHVRCLEHYKQSVGNFHHRTGDGCVKAADHFARTGDGPTALALLDQALKIFYLDTYHKPEAARAHYKKGRVLQNMGQEEESRSEFDKALEIFNGMVPPTDKADKIEDLDDEDFDHWIMFWSR